jgi:hypothetical protein
MAVLAMVLVVVFATSCGGGSATTTPTPTIAPVSSSGQTAADAAIALIQLFDQDQWGPAWDLLHPAQQAVMTREAWTTCAPKANIPVLNDLKVLSSFEENIPIPGTGASGTSVAVIVQFTATSGDKTTTSSVTRHMFLVDGQWRWILSNPAACT